jgi:tripartite ATP-independent transporter DctM subunit
MRQQGYDKKLAYAVCSSAGTIGMLIPPSVLMVVYGILTGDSIGQLLIAGVSPGLSLFLIFSIGIVVMITLKPSLGPTVKIKVTWRERFISLKSLWGLGIVAGVLFIGIFAGLFSPTEAGAVACIVMLIMFLASKYRSFKLLKTSVLDSASTSAMVYFILIAAGIFSRFLTVSTITPTCLNYFVGLDLSPTAFLIIVSIIYVILGCFLDSISMLTITLPLLYPAAMAIGIHPMHFAMVAILAIHIGLITPPLGLNVFAVKGVAEADVTIGELFSGVLPFLFMMIGCQILFIFFPVLSTWLPSYMIQ